MRKIILTFAVVILSGLAVFGQKNIFTSEIGPSFTGTGDAWGIMFANSYSRLVSDWFFVSVGVDFSKYSNPDFEDFTTSYLNGNLNFGYYLPITKDLSIVGILGGYARQADYWSITGWTLEKTEAGDYVRVYEFNKGRYYGLGYNVMLGFDLKFYKNISFSAKLSLQNDTNGDITWTLRPGINFRF